MKTIKKITVLLLVGLFMVSFSQCSSAQKLQKPTALIMGEVYYQKEQPGSERGSSGSMIFLNIISNPSHIILDSIYFQGKKAKLVLESPSLAVARFNKVSIDKPEIIMSDAPFAEYGNQAPAVSGKVPFELKDHECVVSYKDNQRTKYFKIKNVIQKETQAHP